MRNLYVPLNDNYCILFDVIQEILQASKKETTQEMILNYAQQLNLIKSREGFFRKEILIDGNDLPLQE